MDFLDKLVLAIIDLGIGALCIMATVAGSLMLARVIVRCWREINEIMRGERK